MTTNVTGQEPTTSVGDANSPLFSATPVWDRKRKTGLFGMKKMAPVRRVNETAASSLDRSDRAADATPTASSLPDHEPSVGAPGVQNRTLKARSTGNASATTLAAVIGAVGVLGVTGWFITRDDDGIAELASDPMVSVVAATPVQPEPPAIVADTTATPRLVSASARRTAPTPRARPAVSAAETGVNASTTLPDAPQSYTSLNPSAAPQPVVASPPVVAETVPVAPEAIPETPPIAPTPDTTTPPT